MIADGTVLSERYRIVEKIGEGGMATVYLAQDITLDRQVAVKVLRPELARVMGEERFRREIDIAARLDHPHVVPVYDAGESDGALFYVMRHVDGESLADIMRARGELPIEVAARLLRDVAEALAEAHAKGVIHRDIKPDNVLISGRHAAVTDFGIAKAVTDATGPPSLTETGVTLGTPTYMAPEQVTADETLDQRVDVYAFGVMAYELFTGRPPFDEKTAQQVMSAHVTRTPVPVAEQRPTVPAAWNALVMRCLEKRPADRYQSGGELLATIEGTDTIGVTPQSAPRAPRSRRWVAAGVIMAVGVIVWFALGRSDTRSGDRELDPNTIAVFPLAPSTPDTALVRLGRDVALTMSYNLDGFGGLTTADVHAILARASERLTGMTVDEANAVAADYGAARALRGNLVRIGDRLRVEMTVQSVETGATLARAQLETDPGDYRSLTDSLTRLLLPQLWDEGDRPSPRLNAVLDRPLEAVRAFLDGERAYAQGQFTTAERHYLRAIEADSTFWLPYIRYRASRGWNLKGWPAWTRVVLDHLDELPERDRILAETGRLAEPERLDSLEVLVRAYPDHAPFIMEYGERLIHWGPFVGRSMDEAIVAFRRVATLNPRFFPALFHLVSAAMLASDTATSRQAIQQIEALDIEAALAEDYGYPELDYLRLEQSALTGAPDVERRLSAFAPAVANARPSWDPGQRFTALRLAGTAATPEWSVRFNDLVAASASDPEIVRTHRFAAVRATASRGAWDSALVMVQRYDQAGELVDGDMEAYRLAVVGEWLGALDPQWVDERRPTALRAATNPRARAEFAWLEGIVAFARENAGGIARARDALDEAGDDSTRTRLLQQSLDGFALALAGDVREAAGVVAPLEEGAQNTRVRPSFLSAVNRLAVSRWLLTVGDTARAERILQWTESFTTNAQLLAGGITVAPMSLIERARIADAHGRSPLAIRYYERFLKIYDRPPNEAGRQMRREAETALARLRGLRESGS